MNQLELEPNFIFEYSVGDEMFSHPFIVYASGDHIYFFSFDHLDVVGKMRKEEIFGCKLESKPWDKSSIYYNPNGYTPDHAAVELLKTGKFNPELRFMLSNPMIKDYRKNASGLTLLQRLCLQVVEVGQKHF